MRARTSTAARSADASLPDDPRQHLGKAGESAAAETLRAAGYVVLAERYRSRQGEIDLICRHGDAIVFVEVKTRRDGTFGGGAAAVTWRKQRTIARVAEAFLARAALQHLPCRFDVVVVDWPPGESARARIIAGAFDAR